jgi:methylaspartate ammonia-lyase
VLDVAVLMDVVSGLTREVSVVEVVPPPKPPQKKVSRRGLFTQLLAEEETPRRAKPTRRRVVVMQGLNAGILLGINQALWQAATQGVPLAHYLRGEFGLTRPLGLVPVLPALLSADDGLFLDGVYREMPAFFHTPAQIGTHLLETIKQWQTDIITHVGDTYKPAFYFGMGGALGGNADPMLDYLSQLNSHANSHPIYLEDPILETSRDEQISRLLELKRDVRQMAVAFSAKGWVRSLADVQAYLNAEAVAGIHIDLCQFTHLVEVVSAIEQCQKADVKVVLSGANSGLNHIFMAQLVLATQPDWLLVNRLPNGATDLRSPYQEMARTFAQISG